MTESLLGRKTILWTINGINDSLANPGRAPILRTKSVTKKEMNKCMAEIYDPGGIRTRAARLISQYQREFSLTQLLGIVFKSGSSHA